MSDLDYLALVKRSVITGMFSDPSLASRMAVKGGAALDLIYEELNRSSLDVDFSLSDAFGTLEDFAEKITLVLTRTFETLGLGLIDLSIEERPDHLSDDLRDFWGGYAITFKLVPLNVAREVSSGIELRRRAIVLHANHSPEFAIDVSKYEAIDGRVEFEIDGRRIYSYTPVMMVAEKLRAICQQMPAYGPVVKRRRPGGSRGRDFLDIYTLCTRLGVRFDDQLLWGCLREMFAIKRVPLNLLTQIAEQREFHRPDFDKIRDTAGNAVDLESFDFYFDFVIERCTLLQHFWNKNPPT